MSDRELVEDIVAHIMTAIQRIERRFEGIKEPDDFVIDDIGIDKLDGITMMLIATSLNL